MPYFLVGDDAFPLQRWLMKPFPLRNLSPTQRIFNYRFSRARRVVENAFGITAQKWRCLLTTMQQPPTTVVTIVQGILTLHNIMRSRQPLEPGEVDQEDNDGNIVPGAWRRHADLTDNRNIRGNQLTVVAKIQRNHLADYYNHPIGAVPWQDRAVQLNPLPVGDSSTESEMDSSNESYVESDMESETD